MRAMDSCKNAWASNKNLSGKGVEYDFWGQKIMPPKPWDPWNTLVEFAQWNHFYGLNIGFGNMNYQEFSLHRYSEIPFKQQTNNKHSNIKFSNP